MLKSSAPVSVHISAILLWLKSVIVTIGIPGTEIERKREREREGEGERDVGGGGGGEGEKELES